MKALTREVKKKKWKYFLFNEILGIMLRFFNMFWELIISKQ